VTDVGFDAVDAGDLTQARLLEPLAMEWCDSAKRKVSVQASISQIGLDNLGVDE
jgi:predicted dinucleotide-binding enzyme